VAGTFQFNGKGLIMENLKHDCGRLHIKDDPVLLRLTVKTERRATEELKRDIQKIYPSYLITFERFCKCVCHRLPPEGWDSAQCCPDCGRSLCSNVEG